jgi:hypothetical protein
MAQGLGDEDRPAPRDEKGDRGAGASAGRDHAPHMAWTREAPAAPAACLPKRPSALTPEVIGFGR